VPTNGAIATSNLVITIPGGAVRIAIVASDGLPASTEYGYAQLDEGTSNSRYEEFSCATGFTFQTVPAGVHTIVGECPYASGFSLDSNVTVIDDQESVATYAASVVKGNIKDASNAPSSSAEVLVTDTNGGSNYAYTEVNGDYRVIGAAVGSVVVAVQDENGLSASTTGNLAAINTPLVIDLQLPPFGSVQGTLTDAAGAAVEGATVYLESAGVPSFTRSTFTDTQGAYRFEHVGLGVIELTALVSQGGLFANATGTLSTLGQTVTLNMALPAAGSVSGIVTNASGIAATGACVSVRSSEQSITDANEQRIVSDSAGAYSASGVQPGQVLVSAWAAPCSTASAASIVPVQVASGANSLLNVQLGNALYAQTSLLDSLSNFTFTTFGFYGGGLQAYYPAGVALEYGMRMSIDGRSYSGQFTLARATAGGRELSFGPVVLSKLISTRRIYVPNAGGFVRGFETLANPTASPITVTLRQFGTFGRYGYPFTPVLITDPAATNTRYAIHGSPPGPLAGGPPGTVGYIFAGSGGATPDATSFATRDFSWSWTVTVPANSSVAYVNYLSLRTPNLSADVQTQAAALANSTQPGMFEGLSNAERLIIKNFVVPPL